MDSFEFNKMAGAVLGTLVLCMALGIIGESVFYHPMAKPGYALPVPKAATAPAGAPAPEMSLPALLAKADPKKGENDTHVCQACHNLEKGAGVKIGPPLYGVVGRAVASVSGFDYSDSLKKVGGNWTLDRLFAWIKDPAQFAPGTKMAFGGEPDPQKRADIVDYLRTLSDHPEPLPPVPAAPAGGASKTASAAPASGAAAQNAGGGNSPNAQLDAALAGASLQKGEADTRVCQVCHNFEKGAGPKIGPPLYGVVDRPIASVAGFDYSDALKAKKPQKWTFANLSNWITNPQAFAPGTKMAYPGEPDLKKRADILVYLRSLSDHPSPLPHAAAAAGGGSAGSAAAGASSAGAGPSAAVRSPATNGPGSPAGATPATPSAAPSDSKK